MYVHDACYIERCPNGPLDPNLPKCGKKKCTSTDHLLLKKPKYEDELEIWNNTSAPNFWFHVEPTLGWPCCFDRIRRALLTQNH